MNFSSIGDLAQNLMLRRQGADLKTNLSKLTEELTSGRRQDISEHLKGDFSALAGLERSAKRLDAFAQARTEIGNRIDIVQTTLGSIQNNIGSYGTSLLSATSLEQPNVLEAQAATAYSRLDQAVSYLNTQSSGRYLFSGTDSSAPSLISANDILTNLRSIASAATDSAGLIAQIDDWFLSSGGGFEMVAYQGGADSLSSMAISDTRKIDIPIKADDTVFRTMLRDLAMSALISENAVPLNDVEKRDILRRSGESLIAVEDDLTALQRDVGTSQAVLQQVGTQSQVEMNVISLAISDFVNVDKYETASALEAVQYQIETLYVLTARTSQLRLTDFLR